MTRSAIIVSAAMALTACGANHADVPQELIDAIKNPKPVVRPDGGVLAYPAGPYGTEVGNTIQTMCFEGWHNPKAAGFDPAKTGPICLDEYFDPSGARNKLLLIESCAVWCAACKTEYGGSGNRPSLAEHLTARESQGFRVMGTIFQDGASNAATTVDAAAWAMAYNLSFPFAVDADRLIGQYAALNTAPFNLLIDTRSMVIEFKVAGDEPATLFQKVDDFLAKNAGP